MSLETQRDLVWKILDTAANSVGIDLEEYYGGLQEVHNRLGSFGVDFDEDDRVKADELIAKYGNTRAGRELLYALGEALCFSDGSTCAIRPFEPVLERDEDFERAGWSGFAERSFCDFAMFAGVAVGVCHSYKYGENLFSNLGKSGAFKKHEPTRQLKRWAIELYRGKSWKSANQAAYALKDEIISHGRTIGAILSEENAQRTIAEWFRKSA